MLTVNDTHCTEIDTELKYSWGGILSKLNVIYWEILLF